MGTARRRFHVGMNSQDMRSFFERLGDDRKNNVGTDVVFKCEDKKFPCHSLVVSTHSKMLGRIIQDHIEKQARRPFQPCVIEVNTATKTDLEVLVGWMYGQVMKIEPISLFGCFGLAVKFEVEELQLRCCEVIMGELNEGNCTAIFQLASMLSNAPVLKALREDVLAFMADILRSYRGEQHHVDVLLKRCKDDEETMGLCCEAVVRLDMEGTDVFSGETIRLLASALEVKDTAAESVPNSRDLALRTHGGIPMAVCKAVSALCLQEMPEAEEAKRKQRFSSFLLPIAELIRTCSSEPEVVREALSAIWSISADSAENKAICRQTGIIRMITAALAAHLGEADVQVQGCGALYSIVAGSRENIEAFRDEHTLRVFTDVLELHAGDAEVMMHVINTLVNLSANAAMGEEMRGLIREEGLIKLLLLPMELHRGSQQGTSLQLLACILLLNLSREAANRDSIRKSGFIPALQWVLETQATEVQVVQQACGAIRNLCAENSVNQRAVVEAGLVEVVSNVMTMHVNEVEIQEHACGVVRNLCSLPENRGEMRSSGCVEQILNVMLLHNTSVPVLTECCATLANLAEGDLANQEFIFKAGGVDQVASLLDTHSSHFVMLPVVLHTLANLTSGCRANQKMLRDISVGGQSMLSKIVQNMKDGELHFEVLQSSMIALLAMTDGCAANAMAVCDAQGIAVIVAALPYHFRRQGLLDQDPEGRASPMALQLSQLLELAGEANIGSRVQDALPKLEDLGDAENIAKVAVRLLMILSSKSDTTVFASTPTPDEGDVSSTLPSAPDLSLSKPTDPDMDPSDDEVFADMVNPSSVVFTDRPVSSGASMLQMMAEESASESGSRPGTPTGPSPAATNASLVPQITVGRDDSSDDEDMVRIGVDGSGQERPASGSFMGAIVGSIFGAGDSSQIVEDANASGISIPPQEPVTPGGPGGNTGQPTNDPNASGASIASQEPGSQEPMTPEGPSVSPISIGDVPTTVVKREEGEAPVGFDPSQSMHELGGTEEGGDLMEPLRVEIAQGDIQENTQRKSSSGVFGRFSSKRHSKRQIGNGTLHEASFNEAEADEVDEADEADEVPADEDVVPPENKDEPAIEPAIEPAADEAPASEAVPMVTPPSPRASEGSASVATLDTLEGAEALKSLGIRNELPAPKALVDNRSDAGQTHRTGMSGSTVPGFYIPENAGEEGGL